MNLRYIDRLVAEKVMGWKIYADSAGYKFWSINEDDRSRIICSVTSFEPTKDIADAWQVVEKFEYHKVEKDAGFYYCTVRNTNEFFEGVAETAELAICLAALKSVGVEVEVTEQ